MNAEVNFDGGARKHTRRNRTSSIGKQSKASVVGPNKRRRSRVAQHGRWALSLLLKQQTRCRPPKHIGLGKFGMKKFEGIQREEQHCNLRPYSARHMSTYDDVYPITGYGDAKMVAQWFTELTPSVKEKVRKAGFEALLLCLQPAEIDGPLIQALATKWWDTTHTFHFTHVGELTMTPKDFSAITGLPVYGIPLFIKRGIYRDKKLLHQLLGDAVCIWNTKCVPVLWLFETYKTFTCECEGDEDLVVRAFILALLGATIFARPSMDVDLDWLGVMSDVRKIGRYNWGAAALAFLYNQMDDLSRKNTFKFGGLWQAWEVWAREYMKIFPLIIPTTCERVFPATNKWILVQKPEEDTTIRLQYYTIKLENVLTNNINWNPWGNESMLPWYVNASIDASKKRILLIRPNGSAWYLAERVLIQCFGILGGEEPSLPPVCMLDPRTLSIPRTRVALTGQCAHSFISIVNTCAGGVALQKPSMEYGNPIAQSRHTCMEDKEDDDFISVRNNALKIAPTTRLLRTERLRDEKKELELQTLHFPSHVKQVPVATASKLLHVIGGLQILVMESIQNADDKLRATACTLAGIREEMDLHTKPGTTTEGSKTTQDSKTYM